MKNISMMALCIFLCGCGGKTRRFRMPTGAMIPTIQENGYVIADTSTSHRATIKRWDMVVFRLPDSAKAYGVDPEKLPPYVTRIVGLPGEVVDFAGSDILIDGKELVIPPYLAGLRYSGLSEFPPGSRRIPGATHVRLSKEEYFILGDRTTTAIDSRFLGPLPKSNIIGKVIRIE